jgi:hypothetical protein
MLDIAYGDCPGDGRSTHPGPTTPRIRRSDITRPLTDSLTAQCAKNDPSD